MSKTKIYGTAIAIFAILIVLYVMNAMVGSSSGNAKTLRVLVESGSPAETVAKATASEFKDKTGYDVIIDPVPYNGMFDKLATEIKSGRIVHDVAALDVLWLPAFKHALAPLDAIATPEIVEDFLPTLRSGGTLDGKLYGFPMWVNCKVLIYRTDLFADEENKDQFRSQYGYELTPPTTWDEYRDVARFFTRDGMYGTAVFGSASGDTVCSWLDHAAQAGALPLVLDSSGSPVLERKEYVDALELLSRLYRDKLVPEETLSVASTEAQEMFNNSKLAMQLNWSHQYPAALRVNEGKVGVAPMIEGRAGVAAVAGPWYQCVLNKSKNIEAAKEYVRFMYDHNEDYMNAFLRIAGRKSVYQKYGEIPGNEHLGVVLRTLSAAQSQNRPATPHWTEIEEKLAEAVQDALSGNMTPEEALGKAQAAVKRIVK